jgi:hypothetical protein
LSIFVLLPISFLPRVLDEELAGRDAQGSADPIKRFEVDSCCTPSRKGMGCVIGNASVLGQCLDREPLLSGHFANPQPDRHDAS